MKQKPLICYSIDLDKPKLEIKEFSGENLEADLKYFKVRYPRKLSDYDRKVFLSMALAEKYLVKYSKTLKGLNNRKICKEKGIPAILYKRRYIVQSLLKEKNQTFRDSPHTNRIMSKVKVGEMFNLYDQTFLLTVILTKVTKIDAKTFKYNFKLP
jgi:hypothetical protein